jgi:hypothetical protein
MSLEARKLLQLHWRVRTNGSYTIANGHLEKAAARSRTTAVVTV